MRLSVLVTQLQKDSQLLWRPLRIAVDLEASLMRYRQASRSTILALLSGTFCPLSLNLSVFP
jgi:hypothetical protein